ncbi:MAG: hypothetical protein M1812_005374 [Candelaria pacifica]|nr:MAG: hypothetical protein M1812_005374 [Candelaria pacifica]
MTDPLIPHLSLIHSFPTCFPTLRIDRGAVRFVLSGATLMAPGLTSKGGRVPNDGKSDGGSGGDEGGGREGGREGGGRKGEEGDGVGGGEREREREREFEKGEVVAISAEGKMEVCMVGVLSMGTVEIREKGKGVVIEGGHFLGDGLWRLEVG